MSPRAWRWNSDTPSSCSSADTCRDTADCDNPSCSPAWVKLPASAAAWKTLSLSQSMLIERSLSFCRHRRLCLALGGQEALGFERGHAALAGGGHRLAVDVVGDVASGEDPWHRGGGRECGLDVARRLHLHLPDEQLGGRRVADGDEDPVRRMLAERAGLDVAQNDSLDLERVLSPRYVIHHAVPNHRNLRVLEQAVLQDLLGAKTVAAVHHGDAGGEIGEKQRLFDGGIASADHDHLFAAIEKAIAGGAGGDAIALEFLLGRQLQPARLRPGGDDHAVGEIAVAGITLEPERPVREVDLAHVVGDDFGADMLGLLLHLLHQPGPLDDVGEARIVFHVGRNGELAAGLDALDQDRLEHRARGIDRRRITGRTGADDDDLGTGGLSHRQNTPLCACSGARERRRTPVDCGPSLKPSARIGWRWSTPEGAWRLARRPVGKALMLIAIYGFLAAMQDMQNRLPQCRTGVRGEWCLTTSSEQ